MISVTATPPTIKCANDKTVDDDGCTGSQRVWYKLPTVTDDSGVVDYDCVPAPGSIFTVGVTPVTCTATDGAGNTASCTLDVIVVTPPDISCASDKTVDDDGCTGSQRVWYKLPTVTDDSGVVDYDCVPAPGSIFTVGVTPVTCTATDGAGNTASCTLDVIVVTPPDISCASDKTVDDDGCTGSQRVWYKLPTVTDDSGVVDYDCVPAPGSIFTVGVTPVTCTATDGAGNTASCTLDVIVGTY
ncbi:hyalin-like isoform X2 [Ptychodera flava]|uniref:hyalin-like isoform X2 n=1 Tax=Ptychodera flava TaxID=63121 RepID=UPI00396AA02C